MVKIAHVSDLHFGAADSRALAALKSAITLKKPDLVLVTGDLTQYGRRSEFAAAAAYLKDFAEPVFCIPGNHDTPVYNPFIRFVSPWSRFEQHFGPVASSSFDLGPVTVLGVNSARRAAPRLNWAYGRLSPSRISDVAERAAAANAAGKIPVIACHHPFDRGPNRAGAEAVRGGETAARAFAAAGVRIVFTGHVHISGARPLAHAAGKILSIEAGTATSVRERGERPAFNFVDTDGGSYAAIEVWTFLQVQFEETARLRFDSRDSVWIERTL